MTAALRRSVSSLSVPNYRRYFTGQLVSTTGTWMQTVAEMWLVVQLTGSGVAVGLTAALQFLPLLLFGAYGGVVVDRRDKRRLLMITQALMALPALAMLALSGGGVIEIWMVYALVFLRGMANAVDNPARQAFVMEMVGPERVVNAVSLNSMIVQSARIVGPALAGVIIAVAGVNPCFALNAASFLAMLVALKLMDPSQLHVAPLAKRARGQVRAAFAEVHRRAELRIPMLMMLSIGMLCFNFQILLPLFARFTWHGTATTYALLTTAMAVGSFGGALLSSARSRTGPRLLVASAAAFGVAELGAGVAPSEAIQIAVLVPLGAASVMFAAGVNSALQLASDGPLRGRVMALYSVVFLGSTAIGAPAFGWLAEVAGPRSGLLVGGAAALATALWARLAYARAGVEEDHATSPTVLAAEGPGPVRATPGSRRRRTRDGVGTSALRARVGSGRIDG